MSGGRHLRQHHDSLGLDRRPVELLFGALEALQIRKKQIPMRGGTDGAALSARGLPTPNFFTGAYNFHSRYEFLPVPAFEKSYEVARMICTLAAQAELGAGQRPPHLRLRHSGQAAEQRSSGIHHKAPELYDGFRRSASLQPE
jgi:hypothetical protein